MNATFICFAFVLMVNPSQFLSKFQKSSKFGCQLIRTHALGGRLQEALKVFNSLHDQNVYTWTAIISANVQHNENEQAILLYNQMQSSGVEPSSYTFVTVLKACAGHLDINIGRFVHYEIVEQDCKSDLFIENALIYMYASCGCVEDAWEVFSKLPGRDAIAWSSIIGGYAQHGFHHVALELFQRMLQDGPSPNIFTLICVTKACADLDALHQGRLVHACVLKEKCEGDKFIGSTLVNLYTKCGCVEDAYKVFEGLKGRNVVAWSSMILGYAEHGHAEKAIELFTQMQSQGVEPNEVTFVCVLKACWKLSALEAGKDIHYTIMKLGIHLDVLIGSTLVDMYATCGRLEDARNVFDNLAERNVVCWSTMISGYEEDGNDEEAIQLYKRMEQDGIQADGGLYVSIIKACTNLEALDQGKALHIEITKVGLACDPFVGSTLVDMYAKCGKLDDAFVVFNNLSAHDVVSWSALIAGCAIHGDGGRALRVYQDMQKEGVEPNEVTLLSILKACTCLGDLKEGKIIHMHAVELGFYSVGVIGNTLVDMYSKCGSLEDAHIVFEKLSVLDVVSWNALIAGYADNGNALEAFQLSERLQCKGLVGADEFTFLSILKACSTMAASDQGKLVHAGVVRRGLEKELVIGNTLVNMYAKCGSLVDAHIVFDKLPSRSTVSFNAMIAACAEHGLITTAYIYFESMWKDGVEANEVTFVSLLSGCNHAGLIEEGYYLLHSMEKEYDLTPTIQHFICMVDILGRVGCVDEAEDMVLKMPFEPDCLVWMALLSSCEKHGYLQQGAEVFDCFVQASNISAAAYVLMSNIFAADLNV